MRNATLRQLCVASAWLPTFSQKHIPVPSLAETNDPRAEADAATQSIDRRDRLIQWPQPPALRGNQSLERPGSRQRNRGQAKNEIAAKTPCCTASAPRPSPLPAEGAEAVAARSAAWSATALGPCRAAPRRTPRKPPCVGPLSKYHHAVLTRRIRRADRTAGRQPANESPPPGV